MTASYTEVVLSWVLSCNGKRLTEKYLMLKASRVEPVPCNGKVIVFYFTGAIDVTTVLLKSSALFGHTNLFLLVGSVNFFFLLCMPQCISGVLFFLPCYK